MLKTKNRWKDRKKESVLGTIKKYQAEYKEKKEASKEVER